MANINTYTSWLNKYTFNICFLFRINGFNFFEPMNQLWKWFEPSIHARPRNHLKWINKIIWKIVYETNNVQMCIVQMERLCVITVFLKWFVSRIRMERHFDGDGKKNIFDRFKLFYALNSYIILLQMKKRSIELFGVRMSAAAACLFIFCDYYVMHWEFRVEYFWCTFLYSNSYDNRKYWK